MLKKLSMVGYLMPLLSLSALLYAWNTTNPATVGPTGMLMVFFILYVFWASLFFIVFHIGFNFIGPRVQGRVKGKYTLHIKRQRAYYVASILAFAPVLILAMQSVNQLTIRDILLVILFVSLAIFYVLKRS